MKRLPATLLTFLETTLPDETCKIVLNTNGKGHWEVEAFSRYRFDEEPCDLVAAVSRLAYTGVQGMKQKHS